MTLTYKLFIDKIYIWKLIKSYLVDYFQNILSFLCRAWKRDRVVSTHRQASQKELKFKFFEKF